jgi:hypothetical protein
LCPWDSRYSSICTAGSSSNSSSRSSSNRGGGGVQATYDLSNTSQVSTAQQQDRRTQPQKPCIASTAASG